MQSDPGGQTPWHDPNKTTVLPTTPGQYPITDEFPVVQIPKRRPWLLYAGLVVLAIGLGVAAAAATISRGGSPTTAAGTQTPTSTAAPAPTAGAGNAATATEAPDYWRVVGVDDGLNVRSGPGTTNAIVGTLTAGQRHVFTTGVVSNDGGAWVQIALDDSDQVGWVSARFLAPDTAPAPGEPRATVAPVTSAASSTVCFASADTAGTTARISFTNRVEISGEIVRPSGDTQLRQQVSGTLEDGAAFVTLINADTDTITRQRWKFNPANVELGDGSTINVVDCSAIGQ